MIRLTPEARLLGAPFRTYHVLARDGARSAAGGWTRVLLLVVLCAAIAGTATAAAATGRISWSLALSGTACWLPLIALQLITAACVILPVSRRASTPAPLHSGTLAPSPAFAKAPAGKHPGTLAPWHSSTLFFLFFRGHAPWSLWVLAVCAFMFAAPALASDDVIMVTGLVPLAWTAVLVCAYFREVLGLRRRAALIATLVHQLLTTAAIVAYIAWAVQLWPRLLALRLP